MDIEAAEREEREEREAEASEAEEADEADEEEREAMRVAGAAVSARRLRGQLDAMKREGEGKQLTNRPKSALMRLPSIQRPIPLHHDKEERPSLVPPFCPTRLIHGPPFV